MDVLTWQYRTVAIISGRFNEVYGMKIEQIKVTFTAYAVICSYLTVRYYDRISLYFSTFNALGLIFTYTLPPLLYYEAYKIHENSMMSKRLFTRALAKTCLDRMSQILHSKTIKSLGPLKVRVAGIYFLDRMMAPLYLRIIVSYACTVLLTR